MLIKFRHIMNNYAIHFLLHFRPSFTFKVRISNLIRFNNYRTVFKMFYYMI
ncbi:hypothetical protein PDTA9832_31310 [Phytobacter diazotrophicus]|nr:hypothetical protein PDTA9832_31310 [Phytobacter diazotrophicus]